MKIKPLIKFLTLLKYPLIESLGIFLEKKIYVHEGLIRSYPINQVASIIKNNLKLDIEVNSSWNPNNETIIITFHKNKNFDLIKDAIKLMDTLGWMAIQVAGNITYRDGVTIKSMDMSIVKSNDLIKIGFESKFVEKLSYDELSDKLYHLSPIERKDKILKVGLTPRSGDKLLSYPDRIYFLNIKGIEFNGTFNETELFTTLGSQLYGYEKNKEKFSGEYAVFYVDKDFFLKNPIYHDSSFPGAVWTNVNIPPSELKIEKMIKIK